MALSDEERRRLEKLEQDLAAADPHLDRKLQYGIPGHRPARRAACGALVLLPGFALVIVGIITKLTAVGVIGFIFMVGGAHWFLLRR